ncbi:MAG: hypothetical protein Ct9H90mP24_3100 [Methanobacteriota archaeon]|nr:MAG: hypothetical protein Ct9H90mP24_3100 [Euryarchaeota archaeon]
MSTYIHPIDDDNLLTIGIAGGADGLGLDWSITQVSLFNVVTPVILVYRILFHSRLRTSMITARTS